MLDHQQGKAPWLLQSEVMFQNLLRFFEKVNKHVEQGDLVVDIIYRDIQKAFEKVAHQRILSKVMG